MEEIKTVILSPSSGNSPQQEALIIPLIEMTTMRKQACLRVSCLVTGMRRGLKLREC
jgi:hypothetical protein